MNRSPRLKPVLGSDEDTPSESKPPPALGRSTGRPPRAAFVEDVSDHGSTDDDGYFARTSVGAHGPLWSYSPMNHPQTLRRHYEPPRPAQTPPLRYVRVRKPNPERRFSASTGSASNFFIHERHTARAERNNSPEFPPFPRPTRPYGAWPRALPPIKSWESLLPGLESRLSRRPHKPSYEAFPHTFRGVPVPGPTKTRFPIGPDPRPDSTYGSARSDSTWGGSRNTTSSVEADDGRGLCFKVPTDRNPQKLVLYTDILDLGTDEAEGNAWSEIKSYPEEHATCDLVNAKTLEQGSDETGAARTYLARENGTPLLRTGTEPRIVWLWVRFLLPRSIC